MWIGALPAFLSPDRRTVLPSMAITPASTPVNAATQATKQHWKCSASREAKISPSRKDFPTRVRELAAGDPVLSSLAEALLSVIAVMTKEVDTLTRRVLDEVRVEPTCRRLMTAPGVGPLTALAFRATIDQPGRFRKSRDVGAHLGLTPRRYQSGETDVQGRISRCGDELARTALYEAAHSLLIRGTKWSALRA